MYGVLATDFAPKVLSKGAMDWHDSRCSGMVSATDN
jgi:hypothetical protein